MADIIEKAFNEVPEWSKIATVYHKGVAINGTIIGPEQDAELKKFLQSPGLRGSVGTVIGLNNWGRDGGTHLRHMWVFIRSIHLEDVDR